MSTRRSRARRRLIVGVVAVGVLWLVTGVLPIVQYLDARHVPAGAAVQDATVTGFERSVRVARNNHGLRGKIIRVQPTSGPSDTMVLAYRWNYPEVGDTLRVYDDDGGLASPSQASLLQLIGGVLALVVWPVITIGYLRSRRRGGTIGP